MIKSILVNGFIDAQNTLILTRTAKKIESGKHGNVCHPDLIL